MKRVSYGVDEFGNPLGEAHLNAKLSDEDVEHIRDLYDTGMVSYATLGLLYNVSKESIADICKFRRRAATPVAYKTKRVASPKVFAPKDQELKPQRIAYGDEFYVDREFDPELEGLDIVAEVLGSTELHALDVINEQFD